LAIDWGSRRSNLVVLFAQLDGLGLTRDHAASNLITELENDDRSYREDRND